jgi:exodeoxyribonuclease VII large subunit
MSASTPIKLSELTSRIRDTLNNSFGNQSYWVFADITNYGFKSDKNYHYFDLVEKGDRGLVTKINAVAWGEGHQHIKQFEKSTGQLFKTGIHVLIRVTVEYHILHGLKLTLIDIDTSFTLGELEKQKQETLNRLLTECPDFIRMVGEVIVTRNKGHLLKPVIQKIAVVSSKQSAGFEDFMHTLNNNGFGYTFFVDPYFSSVQGEANAEEIFQRLLDVFHAGKPYDAVVIIRGGGSETDFLIFNQYNLGKIVAKFPIPIITGIGHQKNETIVDQMAHTATKTPTKSAEFIIAHNRIFEEKLLSLENTIIIKAQQVFHTGDRQVSQLKTTIVNRTRDYLNRYREEMVRINRITVNNSGKIIHEKRNELVSVSSRLITIPRISIGNRLNELQHIVSNIKTFNAQYLKNQVGYLGHFVSMVRIASPQNILKRGFAIVKKNNHIITNPDQIKKGDRLMIVLNNGGISATVTDKKILDGSEQQL